MWIPTTVYRENDDIQARCIGQYACNGLVIFCITEITMISFHFLWFNFHLFTDHIAIAVIMDWYVIFV